MSEASSLQPLLAQDEPNHSAPRERAATIALLVATLFWGCGFTWAKEAGAAVNARCGLPQGAPLGPVWLLAIRFACAGFCGSSCSRRRGAGGPYKASADPRSRARS